jgi:4-carboxymuconolactone decarboxylase
MKRVLLGLVVCSAASVASTADTGGNASMSQAVQQITRAGTQPSVAAPSEHFTGRARVDPLSAVNGEINASSAYVTFEPGAHTAWHTHPKGQYLVVTAGVGLTQEWGKPIQEIRPGDVVWCPPGVKHWHGAAPTTTMTHLAITGAENGKSVSWMEKVSDEQYNSR